MTEARDDLKRLRASVAKNAKDFGLAPIAASCHPFASWKDQHHVNKDRYNDLRRDLAGVVRRMLICGMHVHVGIPDPDTRIDLVNQLSYFLPHLLAMSASSPFWQGEDTGLASYRLTVFDNLPRTGLPPQLGSWSEYERSVQALVDIGVIEDSSKIWWDLRPSSRFPTIESTHLRCATAVWNTRCQPCRADPMSGAYAVEVESQKPTLAALRQFSGRPRIAGGHNVTASGGGLIDFGHRRDRGVSRTCLRICSSSSNEDAEALGCTGRSRSTHAVSLKRAVLHADRQRTVFHDSLQAEKPKDYALQDVVRHLIDEYHTRFADNEALISTWVFRNG